MIHRFKKAEQFKSHLLRVMWVYYVINFADETSQTTLHVVQFECIMHAERSSYSVLLQARIALRAAYGLLTLN